MALNKQQKADQVTDLIDKMKRSESMIFAHYIGLSVADVSDLRKRLRESNAEMKVAKKTLMKIAAKEAGLPELPESELIGPVSIIFSFGDPISGAQIAFKFGKDHDKVKLIGGVFDGKVLSMREAVSLAQVPSREVLLAMFAMMIRSPLVSFASMCNSPLSGFARALDQLAEKGGLRKEAPAAPAAEAPKEEPKVEASTAEEKPAAESAAPTAAAEPSGDAPEAPPADDAEKSA